MAKYFFNQFIDMITSRLHFQNFILGWHEAIHLHVAKTLLNFCSKHDKHGIATQQNYIWNKSPVASFLSYHSRTTANKYFLLGQDLLQISLSYFVWAYNSALG